MLLLPLALAVVLFNMLQCFRCIEKQIPYLKKEILVHIINTKFYTG